MRGWVECGCDNASGLVAALRDPRLARVDRVRTLLGELLGFFLLCPRFFAAGLLDCPHYTRPEVWEGEPVPAVLMSGHHAEIERWRLKQALGRTWQRRPDVLERRGMTKDEVKLLEEYRQELLIKAVE